MSTKVLGDLRKWIEESEDVYVGKHKQVAEFREKREDTLEQVRRELGRREVGEEIGEEEGYLGAWDDVAEDLESDVRCLVVLGGARSADSVCRLARYAKSCKKSLRATG